MGDCSGEPTPLEEKLPPAVFVGVPVGVFVGVRVALVVGSYFFLNKISVKKKRCLLLLFKHKTHNNNWIHQQAIKQNITLNTHRETENFTVNKQNFFFLDISLSLHRLL